MPKIEENIWSLILKKYPSNEYDFTIINPSVVEGICSLYTASGQRQIFPMAKNYHSKRWSYAISRIRIRDKPAVKICMQEHCIRYRDRLQNDRRDTGNDKRKCIE